MPPFSEEIIKAAKEAGKPEQYIDAITKYCHRLEENNYPIIFSTVHLAQLLGFKISYLVELIQKRQTKYRYFKMVKKRGGYREIMAPQEQLKYVQKWLLINILNKISLTEASTGFKIGSSIFQNAKIHENAPVLLRVDLLKFYDTIHEKRVYGAFKNMGYTNQLSFDLSKIATACHRDSFWESITEKQDKDLLTTLIETKPAILPQGAPTSAAIANLIANKMDKRFLGLIKAGGRFKYSRYADDLVFSSSSFSYLPDLSLIKRIINEEGFFINAKKTKYFYKGSKQYVTGLTITNGVNVSKKYRKDILMHLHYCKKFGVEQHLSNWSARNNGKQSNVYSYQDWLFGKIAFVNSVNQIAAQKMFDQFNNIDWTIN